MCFQLLAMDESAELVENVIGRIQSIHFMCGSIQDCLSRGYCTDQSRAKVVEFNKTLLTINEQLLGYAPSVQTLQELVIDPAIKGNCINPHLYVELETLYNLSDIFSHICSTYILKDKHSIAALTEDMHKERNLAFIESYETLAVIYHEYDYINEVHVYKQY